MDLPLWIHFGLGLFFWLLAWSVMARFARVPQLPSDLRGVPRITVIIPARNEEENIGRLLESLNGQSFRPHEVIVVDDQSSDATAARAKEAGATVLSGAALPDGWLGKPWALHQGAEAASGDWFLFLDADTTFEDDGFERLAGLAHDPETVHSVCPHHQVRAPYEQLSAFFNVIMILGMNAFTLRGERAAEIGLFGQAMLVSRRAFETVGGHEPVKGEVLENFHLSRHFAERELACRCWLGAGTIRMRMFPGGTRDLVAGWSKGFVSGAGNTAKGALWGISLWISGLFMGAIGLALAALGSPPVTWALVGFYVLCVAQVFYLFRKAGNFSLLSALTYPVGLLFYHWVFFRALGRKKRGETVQWKGRDVG